MLSSFLGQYEVGFSNTPQFFSVCLYKHHPKTEMYAEHCVIRQFYWCFETKYTIVSQFTWFNESYKFHSFLNYLQSRRVVSPLKQNKKDS